MNSRYLQLPWWVKRLARPVEAILPPPWIMPALAWATRVGAEPELALLADIVPADRLAVDVGAAEGVYTWYLSRLAASCVAFEADPRSADRIRRRVPQATLHACALSETEGEGMLRLPIVNTVTYNGWATIEPENTFAALAPDSVETLKVPMRTLDSFALQNVGFVKIDVEGHELAVLHGAAETIHRWRPTILIEVENRHRGGAVESVCAWFREAGYAVVLLKGARLASELDQQTPHNRNLLFQPSEQKA